MQATDHTNIKKIFRAKGPAYRVIIRHKDVVHHSTHATYAEALEVCCELLGPRRDNSLVGKARRELERFPENIWDLMSPAQHVATVRRLRLLDLIRKGKRLEEIAEVFAPIPIATLVRDIHIFLENRKPTDGSNKRRLTKRQEALHP